jgi:hypothetical protein
MGACVLCGKSAGLLHSLHKNCYQQYHAETELLVDNLANQLNTSAAEQLAANITIQVESLPFVTEARARTLVRALELFAKKHLHSKPGMQKYADAWPSLLACLELDKDLFIDPKFLSRQQNLAALSALSQGVLPACNVGENALLLAENETLWWRFDEAGLGQLLPPSEEKKWSVATQLIDNLLPKKQKRVVSNDQDYGSWVLSVTNQRLLFICNAENQMIRHQDIYSVTPVDGGVKVQCKQQKAMPQFVRCEDERLLYLLIRHAQTIYSQQN